MQHPDNRSLVRYWHALRAGRRCPRRTEIDPRKINADIGHLFILEDLGRGNIRFRLAGSALVEAFWMELRGMPAHAIVVPEARASLRELVRETLDEPGIGRARLAPRADGAWPDWEIVLLPLRSEQGEVDRVLGALRPLGAWLTDMAEPPLAFGITAMSITPVIGGGEDDERRVAVGEQGGPGALAGLLSGRRPSLRAIEGGGRSETGAAPRPPLRVVDGDR